MRRTLAHRLLLSALGLLLMGAGSPVSAEIYGWTDERGVPHYSDRPEDVPPAFRDQISLLDPTEQEEARSGGLMEGFSHFLDDDEAEGDVAFEPNVDAFEARRLANRFQGPMMLVGGAVGLAMLGLVLAIATWVLLISCGLVGQESPGFKKGYGIVVVQFLAGAALAPGVVVVLGTPDGSSLGELLGFQLAQGIVSLAVSAMVLRAMLCDTLPRAIGLAIVVTLVAFALGAMLGLGVITCAGGAAILSGG